MYFVSKDKEDKRFREKEIEKKRETDSRGEEGDKREIQRVKERLEINFLSTSISPRREVQPMWESLLVYSRVPS